VLAAVLVAVSSYRYEPQPGTAMRAFEKRKQRPQGRSKKGVDDARRHTHQVSVDVVNGLRDTLRRFGVEFKDNGSCRPKQLVDARRQVGEMQLCAAKDLKRERGSDRVGQGVLPHANEGATPEDDRPSALRRHS
jgi:hypothetical protein